MLYKRLILLKDYIKGFKFTIEYYTNLIGHQYGKTHTKFTKHI